MDTSDSRITFDKHGVCDHCNDFYNNVLPNWHTDDRDKQELEAIVARIKKDGIFNIQQKTQKYLLFSWITISNFIIFARIAYII
jgi:hypothetical protein